MKRHVVRPAASDPVARDARAAEWLDALEAGATPQQRRELAAWLEADPRNRAAYAELEATSRQLDPLRRLRPLDGSAPDPNLPLRPGAPRRRLRTAVVWFVPLAAAAAMAVAYLGTLRSPEAGFSQTASTVVGEIRRIVLPDRSVMDLNTDTEVRVAFTAAERRIELARGEAHFTVAKNAARPFIVSAGGISVRAVGTAFNVRRFAASVEVMVTAGKVGVQKSSGGALPAASRPPAPAEILAAGQKAVVSAAADVRDLQPVRLVRSPVSTAEISQKLSWQEKRLDFAPTALKDIVAEFNRYSRHRLVIADDEVATLNVGGSFRAGEVEALVRLLQSNFEVEADVRRDETILRRKR